MSGQNPIADLYANPASTQATPDQTSAPAPSSNPIADLYSSGSSASPSEPTAPQTSSGSGNPIADLYSTGTSTATATLQPPPVSDLDESTIGKVWDWVNQPLLDATRLGTREGAGPIEQGIERGAEKVASGFTSP